MIMMMIMIFSFIAIGVETRWNLSFEESRLRLLLRRTTAHHPLGTDLTYLKYVSLRGT